MALKKLSFFSFIFITSLSEKSEKVCLHFCVGFSFEIKRIIKDTITLVEGDFMVDELKDH